MNEQHDDRAGLPSASGAPRLVHCAGSVAAEAQNPGEEQTELATSGSAIHLALESGKAEGLDVKEKDVAEHLSKIEVDAIEAWKKDFNIEKVEIFRETRLWIRDGKLNPMASAKPDVIAKGISTLSGNKIYALVLDFKSGFLDADPAESNWQIKTQAIAVAHEHPDVHHVRAAIIQHRFKSRYDPVDFEWTDLQVAFSELKFYIHLSKQPDAPRVPGGWCRYCRARGTETCPESKAYALIPNVIAPITHKDQAAAMVIGLSIDQLASIRSRKTLIEAILEAVEARMKQLTAEQLASVGLELKPNSPTRTLPNIQKVYELLVRENLIEDDEEFRGLCKVGVGAVEELIIPRLQKKLGLDTVKAADAECTKLIAPLVVPVPKNPSLKPLKAKK